MKTLPTSAVSSLNLALIAETAEKETLTSFNVTPGTPAWTFNEIAPSAST